MTQQLTWTDSFLTGYDPMDTTHREFVELVNTILQAPDADIPKLLDELITHSQHHFSQEDHWMTSTDFPATECHVNEHAAVLKSMHEVKNYLAEGGDISEARRLASELARWFPGHTDYLDASLAQWVSKKQLGGVPVVVRRNVANHDTA